VLHSASPRSKRAGDSTRLLGGTWQLLGRDHERMGVDGSRGKRRRSCDQPDRNSGKSGGEKGREENRIWPVHRIDLLEIFEMLEASPAIFEINQTKNERHGINSIVDYATKIAGLCFKSISSGDEIDFVGRENGFGRCLKADVRPGLAGTRRFRPKALPPGSLSDPGLKP
jgi:hypothetical protein